MCQGEDTRNITNKSDCAEASYRWVRHKYNFDNLGQVSPGPGVAVGVVAGGPRGQKSGFMMPAGQWTCQSPPARQGNGPCGVSRGGPQEGGSETR